MDANPLRFAFDTSNTPLLTDFLDDDVIGVDAGTTRDDMDLEVSSSSAGSNLTSRHTQFVLASTPSTQSAANTGAQPNTGASDEVDDAEVILSLFWANNRLGIAYYVMETQELHITETHEEDDFSCVQLIKYDAQPTTILVSSKAPGSLLLAVGGADDQETAEASSSSSSPPMAEPAADDIRPTILKASDYAEQAAIHKIKMLKLPRDVLPYDLDNCTDSERLALMSTFVNFEWAAMVRALGGLLSYLLKVHMTPLTSTNNAVPSRDAADLRAPHLYVNAIHQFSLEGLLTLDANTFNTLQIFNTDRHPTIHQLGKSKEGLSLFSLFHAKTSSSPGRKLLRVWFVRPILKIDVIQARQQCVAYFSDPRRHELLEELASLLRTVKDVPRILARFRSVTSSQNDWLFLHRSIGAMKAIRDIMVTVATSAPAQDDADDDDDNDDDNDEDNERKDDHPVQLPYLFAMVEEYIDPAIDSLMAHMSRILDFAPNTGSSSSTGGSSSAADSSSAGACVCVRDGVDDQLDNLRAQYDAMDTFLNAVATEEIKHGALAHVPDLALRFVYFPQIGFLVVLPTRLAAHIHSVDEFEFQFATDAYVYYKNDRAHQMDDHFGDLYALIVDRQQYILRQLEAKILANASTLSLACAVVAELDCLLAFTRVAVEYNYTCPQLTEDTQCVSITRGRHPLQELCVDVFIPNDTQVENNDVQLLTGANFSGKSVYMKQVALITYMAHLGSYVPADDACIGFTDRIFTRIHGRETVSVDRSSFMIDLHQIAVMLRHMTHQSLLLVDEFGKGTSWKHGLSLMYGLVATLLDLSPANRPKALVCTHFHELMHTQLLSANTPGLNLLCTQIVQTHAHENDDGIPDLVFLYQIQPGSATSSFAFTCAARAGIPAAIAQRGLHIAKCIADGEAIEPLHSERTARKEEEYRDVVERFMDVDVDDVEAVVAFVHTLQDRSSRA